MTAERGCKRLSCHLTPFNKFSGFDIGPWHAFIKESVRFFDEHYRMRCKQLTGQEYDGNGRYRFAPAKSMETYKEAVNPLPPIAARASRICAPPNRICHA
jgi:hypothetical protein